MAVLPGLILALVLAFAGQYLSELIGIDLMGLPKSPVSAIMMAIILGIIIRNTITLPVTFQPGIRFRLGCGGAAGRHVPGAQARSQRQAGHADRRGHEYLRRHGHRRHGPDNRGKGRRGGLLGCLHHAIRCYRDAVVPVRRTLDFRRSCRQEWNVPGDLGS